MHKASFDIEELLWNYKTSMIEVTICDALLEAVKKSMPPDDMPGARMATLRIKIEDYKTEKCKQRSDALCQAQRVTRILDRLPSKQGEVLRLHYVNGLSYEAIAERLHYCPQTIYDLRKKALVNASEIASHETTETKTR